MRATLAPFTDEALRRRERPVDGSRKKSAHTRGGPCVSSR
jgi:hypothetical protein